MATATDDQELDPNTAYCEACEFVGIRTLATTHSTNTDWASYRLCAECAAEYDSRPAYGPLDD